MRSMRKAYDIQLIFPLTRDISKIIKFKICFLNN